MTYISLLVTTCCIALELTKTQHSKLTLEKIKNEQGETWAQGKHKA